LGWPPALTPGMSVRATLFLRGDEASLDTAARA
jgi:hypothetical protein